MSSFGYASLQTKKSGVEMRCTEADVIKSVVELVSGLVPSSKASIHNDPITGAPMSCRVKKLSGHDLAIGEQIVNHLCHLGWEPFQVDNTEDVYRLHFRRAIEPAG
jgi:hypothetical protein